MSYSVTNRGFSIKATASPSETYPGRGSSGVVVGYTSKNNYLTDCYRKADIEFQDNWLGNVPFDQANASPTVPLVTDTETEMHNPYFSASVLEYAGLDHSGLGVSYNDVITQDLHIERLFCPLDFGGHNDRPRLPGVYHINGNAADPDNWNYIKQ